MKYLKQCPSLIIAVLLIIVGCGKDPAENLEMANKKFQEKDYQSAVQFYEQIPNNANEFSLAQEKIKIVKNILATKKLQEKYGTFEGALDDILLSLPKDFVLKKTETIQSGKFMGFTEKTYYGDRSVPRVIIVADGKKGKAMYRIMKKSSVKTTTSFMGTKFFVGFLAGYFPIYTLFPSDVDKVKGPHLISWNGDVKRFTKNWKRSNFQVESLSLTYTRNQNLVEIEYLPVSTYQTIRLAEVNKGKK